jgi:Protein of unknown function (DUF2510)
MNWEYKWLEAGTGVLSEMAVHLNALGSVGWEVCGFAASDRTVGLNKYAVLLKRPRAELAPLTSTEAAWNADRAGRFQQRYWDGVRWTEHVSSGGKTDVDPPVLEQTAR